jgi:hypothetical protein
MYFSGGDEFSGFLAHSTQRVLRKKSFSQPLPPPPVVLFTLRVAVDFVIYRGMRSAISPFICVTGTTGKGTVA